MVDKFAQVREFHRLGHMTVHASFSRAVAVLAEDMRSQGNDGSTPARIPGFPFTQLVGGLKAVEHGHLAIHQDQVIRLRLDRLQRLFAVAGGVRLQVEFVQHAADDLGGNTVVLGDQDAEVTRDFERGQVLRHRCLALLSARLALREFVGQGGLQRVTGDRFGEDALDTRIARNDLARCAAHAGEHDQQDVMVEAVIFLDLARQLHAGHAGHVLIEQDHIEVFLEVRLGPQQGQRLLARRNGANLQAPAAALLDQYLAAGVVVIDDQQASALQWPVQVGIALRQPFTGQRQADPQGVALAGASLDTEITIHQLHQLARDDQPQAPAMACRRKKVMTVDCGIEQCVALVRLKRTPTILHGDAQARALGRSVDRGDQQHLALVGLLEGILQQVEKGLAQTGRIAGHDLRQLRLDKADQLDLLLFGLGAEDAQTVFDQRVEIELHVIQLDLARFQLGNVENLVDQIEQFVAGAMNRLDVVALLGRQRCAQQQLAHAQHAVHWRSQFMADLGQEIGLGLEFRAADGRCGELGAAVGLALPLTFEQGKAE